MIWRYWWLQFCHSFTIPFFEIGTFVHNCLEYQNMMNKLQKVNTVEITHLKNYPENYNLVLFLAKSVIERVILYLGREESIFIEFEHLAKFTWDQTPLQGHQPIHHLVDTNHTVLPRGSTTKLPQSAFALGAPGSTAPSFTEFFTHRLTTCCCFHYYYANAAATAFTLICLIWSKYFFKKRPPVKCSWTKSK